jgi:hypothetical protein
MEASVPSKLSGCETTLERSLYKALRELQRLQAARRADSNASPPVAIDVDISGVSRDEHKRDGFRQQVLRPSIPPLYRRYPAETLLGRDLKHDFDALPRRSSMANFYLPLSPRTHDQVPRCLLCSPIT